MRILAIVIIMAVVILKGQGQQYFYDLTQSNFSANSADWTCSTGGFPTNGCFGLTLLGGYGYFGAGSYAYRTFSGLLLHTSVTVQWRAYYVDSWDGFSGANSSLFGDSYLLYADGVLVFHRTYEFDSIGTTDSCGASYPDYLEPESVNFAHNSSSLLLKFATGLDQDPTDESFGVSDITIIVNLICDSTCNTCSGNGNNDCTSCTGSLYLSGSSCVSTCPDGTYPGSPNTCQSCDSSCKTCNNGYTYSCTSCISGFFVNLLPVGYCTQCYQGSISPYTCATCNAGANNNCLSCNPESYLYNSQCIYPCPGGYYADTSSNKCLQCYQSGSFPYTCATCTGNANNQCTSCNTGYYLYLGQCLSICSTGFWADPNSNCQLCWTSASTSPYSCKSCSGGGNSDCNSCNTGYYLYPNTGGQCLTSCPVNYWSDPATNKCLPCYNSNTAPYYTCFACNGGTSSNCLSCSSGTFLYHSSCWNTCPNGYWEDGVSNTCNLCWSSSISPYSCVTCNAQSSGSCLKCNSGYYLYPNTIGQCLLTCPDGYWANSTTGTCDSCWINSSSSPYSCKTCSNGASSSQCTACSSGAFLYPNTGGQCVFPCPNGFWGDTYSNKCQSCWSSSVQPYTCATCNGSHSTNCLSCNSGYFLYQGQCINPCPNGYYGDASSRQCKPCWYSVSSPFSCKTCDAGTSSNCLSCNIGTFQYPASYGSCLNVCPTGFYADNSDWKCKSCYSTGVVGKNACYSCSGPLATNCLSCSAPSTYYSPVDKSCVTVCPNGYYADTSAFPNNQCRQCYQYSPPSNLDSSCSTCNGPASTQCLSCNSSQFLDNTTYQCVNTCPTGWWGDLTTNKCKPCYQAGSPTAPQSCQTCNGATAMNCTSCSSESFLYSVNGSCLLSCPSAGFWGDPSSNTCKACYQYTSATPTANTCASCSGGNSSNCLSCNSTTFLDETTNQCVSTCPTGYYGDITTNICQSCYSAANPSTDIMKSCETCSGPNQNNCLGCNTLNYYYSVNNTCLGGCPDGWYPNSALNLCIQCYQNIPPSTWGTCATCTSSAFNNCITCLSSSYYYDPTSNTCVKSCPAGLYGNNSTKQCTSCYQAASTTTNQQSCYTCKGPLPTDCSSCQNGPYYYAQESQCLLTCPTGTYPNNFTFTCNTCYTSGSSSSSSNNNNIYETQQTYSCAACSGPDNDQCTGCFAGSYLDNSASTCVNICPNGTYGDNQTLICQPCYNSQKNGGSQGQFSCATCSGPSSTQCLSCAAPLALLTTSGVCTDTCPCQSGNYYNPTAGTCGLCSSTCTYCIGPADADCNLNSSVTLECLIDGSIVNNNQRAQATGAVAQGGSYSTAIIALITNILSGGISMGASTVLSVLALLGIYQYFNVNYSTNLVVFFQYVFAGNPINFPNLFVIACKPSAQLLNVDSNVQGNNKFDSYQVSRIFLANSGGDVSLLFCLAGLVPFLLLAYHLLMKSKAKHKIQKFMEGAKKFLMWNFILSNFMGSFASTLLSICIQFRYAVSVTDFFEIFSIVVCVIVTLGYFAFMPFTVYVTFSKTLPNNRPELIESVKVLLNEEELTQLHENDNLKIKYWAFALCTRNFLLVPAIALLSEHPIVQCSLALAINLTFFITVSIWNFFASKTKRIIMRICEGFNTAIPVLFLLYGINDLQSPSNPLLSDQAQQTIGWVAIVLISLVMIMSLLYTLTDTWFMLWQLLPIISKFLRKICRRNRKSAVSTENSAHRNPNDVATTNQVSRINGIEETSELRKAENTFFAGSSMNTNVKENSSNVQKDALADLTINNQSMIIAENSAFRSSSFFQSDQHESTDREFLNQPQNIVNKEPKKAPTSNPILYSKSKKQKTVIEDIAL